MGLLPRFLEDGSFDAALFDMDGVLTDTAALHARAWKELFDAFLRCRATERDQPFVPFDIDSDYLRHVDGKPRYDGVRDFLRSRQIELPMGAPDDAPGAATVCGLGNRKQELISRAIAGGEVRVYPGAILLVRSLRHAGLKTAVVTSSRNRTAVMQAAGIADLFDVAVDGDTILERGLAGKPAPDALLCAVQLLGVQPKRAIVFEDALSGVEAAARGGFGLIVGVGRERTADALRARGAHLVAADLAELLV